MKKIGKKRREKLIYNKKRSRESKIRKRIKIGIISDLECEKLEVERKRREGCGEWMLEGKRTIEEKQKGEVKVKGDCKRKTGNERRKTVKEKRMTIKEQRKKRTEMRQTRKEKEDKKG